jgi:hypothetical protein
MLEHPSGFRLGDELREFVGYLSALRHRLESGILSPVRRIVPAVLAVLVVAGSGCGADGEMSTSASEKADSAILGHWIGTLHQKHIGFFKVRATIGSLDDPQQNRVSYTGIDCGGNWTFLGSHGSVNRTYRFREVIDRGRGGNCKGVGIVTLLALGDRRPTHVRYEFRGGGVVSEGMLARRASG